uniref:Prolyl 4-hydroxylase alpha subunit domain-containing protein n=1 Tax=Brassica oleracea var. oleracea TaxID=109376 RepID=A0A0D3A1P1_BRAOL
MSTSTSPSTTSLYLKQRMHKLKIYGVSDLMQHIDTFKETMGDSVTVKIDDFNNLSILLCSLPPLLTALTCNMEKVDASLRFPHERWPEVISMKPRAFLYHNFVKNEECEHLISLAKPKMVRSIVSNAITGVQGVSSGRTSTGSFISRGHDKIVEEIENRISEFTFLPVGQTLTKEAKQSSLSPVEDYLFHQRRETLYSSGTRGLTVLMTLPVCMLVVQ